MKNKLLKYLFLLAAVVSLSAMLAACGSKVNHANFAKIEIGMTLLEVDAILGPPTASNSINIGILSGATSEWKGPDGTIIIQFFNGMVRAKQFYKPDNY